MILPFFNVETFTKMEDTQCSPNYNSDSYSNVEEAKAACAQDVNCSAVFHYGCSGASNLDLCPKDAKITSASSGSCIYRKGIYFGHYCYRVGLHNSKFPIDGI